MTGMTETKEPSLSPSGARRAARLAAVQALYQTEYDTQRREGLCLDEGERIGIPDAALIGQIMMTAKERRDDIDRMLDAALAPDWTVGRLEAVLRATLRAGVAELLDGAAASPALVINDYVDVAHAFFSGREPGLVNAVLDKIAARLRG